MSVDSRYETVIQVRDIPEEEYDLIMKDIKFYLTKRWGLTIDIGIGYEQENNEK